MAIRVSGVVQGEEVGFLSLRGLEIGREKVDAVTFEHGNDLNQ